MNDCQPASRPAGPERRVVLVVEDEVVLRMAVCAHLREAGFVVIEAVDADEAVDLVRANREIQLVFSDITMPGGLDGEQLATWIGDRYPEIQILLTSGVSRHGGRAFIAKPYSFLELQHRLEEMLPIGQD